MREYWGDRPIGEARVKVKLTNVFDAALARRGQLKPHEVRTCLADALVDTGAVRTVLPQAVVDALSVETLGERTAEYAVGHKDVVPLTDAVQIEMLGRYTVDKCLVLRDEVLIGQTVLEKTDLLVDYAYQRLVPNPALPDQPVTKVEWSA